MAVWRGVTLSPRPTLPVVQETIGSSVVEGVGDDEEAKTLEIGALLRAAIQSRSNKNVYDLVTAIQNWVNHNTGCFVDR